MSTQMEVVEIRKEIEIAAPIATAFEALLDELGPESQLPDGTSMAMKIEPWPGGRWFRDLGEQMGHLWGHVQVIKPPSLLELCGPLFMSYPAVNHVQYRLAEEKGGTRMTLLHRSAGLITPEHREGMTKGWGIKLERVAAIAMRKLKSKRP